MAAGGLAVALMLVLLASVRGRIVEVRLSGSSWGRQRSAPDQGRLTLADWSAYDERDNNGPGTYSFGYDIDDPASGNTQFRQEERHANGTVTGSYGLVEPDGNVRVVTYVADHLGYRVKMDNSLHGPQSFPRSRSRAKAMARPLPLPVTRVERQQQQQQQQQRQQQQQQRQQQQQQRQQQRQQQQQQQEEQQAIRGEAEWLPVLPGPGPGARDADGAQLQRLESMDPAEPEPEHAQTPQKHYRTRTRVQRVRVSPLRLRAVPGPGRMHHFQLPPVPLLDHLMH